ncbi:hypothetical protein M427DRAFT_36342 [Gonapodya prolifera JEL478]|uniref:Uncharacterized protein n=1 Tax=Gonapodya prolifera (strain JEL478) TaxID=1344416 RepID=A0A139A2J7_GONPJ|nr:hypothetical protein M427DRAFT_36342 [Gonapodya prolifera JEL478]|eukprot:KXS11010.1 hypothetical protein M427DRAFT_36342 [Gonapodya prolifera JEL478]
MSDEGRGTRDVDQYVDTVEHGISDDKCVRWMAECEEAEPCARLGAAMGSRVWRCFGRGFAKAAAPVATVATVSGTLCDLHSFRRDTQMEVRAQLLFTLWLCLLPHALAQFSPSPDCAFVEQLFDLSSVPISWSRSSCCNAGTYELFFTPPRFFCLVGKVYQISAPAMGLSGPIPPIGNMTQLSDIDLGNNA